MLIGANWISSVSIHIVVSRPYISNHGITHCITFILFVSFVYLASIANELKHGVAFKLILAQFLYLREAYVYLSDE